MAKCKLCKTDISNGTEYCNNCLDKANEKSNERYLDSLLNSVKNTEPNQDAIYKKKNSDDLSDSDALNKSKALNNSNAEVATTLEYADDKVLEDIDDFDIGDFDQFSFDEDLADFQADHFISETDLFGDQVPDFFLTDFDYDRKSVKDSSKKNAIKDKFEDTIEETQVSKRDIVDDIIKDNKPHNKEDAVVEDAIQEDDIKEDAIEDSIVQSKVQNQSQWDDDYADLLDTQHVNQQNEAIDEDDIKSEKDITTKPDSILNQDVTAEADSTANQEDASNQAFNDLTDNVNEEEIHNYSTNDDLDSDLNDLLNGLDTYHGEEEVHEENPQEVFNNQESVNSEMFETHNDSDIEENADNFYQSEEEDDFLALLNQISSDDPVADDVKAIGDLMNGVPGQPKPGDSRTDVGAVFSDALKVVSNLNDPNINEDEILGKLESSKGKKKKDKKTRKKSSQEEQDSGDVIAKPKKSLFQRLFGNIKNNQTENNKIRDEESILEASSLQTPEKQKPKKNKSSASKEKAKDSKKRGTDEVGEGEPSDKKEKKKKIKEKKPKKQKTKEFMEVIDDIDEDVGRINRLGASIVFLFFGLLALLLYVGSNTLNYTIAIKHATTYFDKQKYTQAYYEVYGVDIKDEDIQIYKKIETVMFVNKELNSYNNYSSLKEYPQALDSLLKGLKRYDKYIELAGMLGIKTDMDYVRKQILAEIHKVFNLSETEATKMIKIKDMKEYSLKVYDVILENKENLQSKGMKKNDSNN